MKILIYTHAFAPMVGGVETMVMSLAVGLAGLTSDDGTEVPDVTLVTPAPRQAFNDESLPFRVVRRPTGSQLVRLIREADVTHLAGPVFFPMLVALVLRRPLVVEHHGFQVICPNGQLLHELTQKPCPGHFMAGEHAECVRCNFKVGRLNSLRSWFLTFPRRWLCQRVQANIMPTEWLGQLLDLPQSTVIYHGLPRKDYGKESQPSSQPTTFAFVGRLVGTKGLHSLLQAAQQVRAQGYQFRLKVIGDGPDRELLRRQASSLGICESTQFLGYLPADGLEEQLADAAAVIMPSLAGEVFGMVAAENMLRGKLMIVSDVGSLREVVGDTGLVFAPGDAAGLAHHMKRVVEDADLSSQLGKKARRRASEQFSMDKMLSQHLHIYREAIKCER